MKIFCLTSLISCFVAASLYAQDPTIGEQWFEGSLVTTEGDTIEGMLSYNMMTNVVKIRAQGRMTVHSGFQIFHFRVWDERDHKWRQFYCIHYAIKNHHTAPALFELLSEGKLSLLARESWNNTRGNDRLNKQGYLKKDYFFIDREGNMAYCLGRKSQVLDLMQDHAFEVRRYIRELYLDDFRKERHLRMVTTFYNKLVFMEESKEQKAKPLAQTSPKGDLILGATKQGTQTWSRTDL